MGRKRFTDLSLKELEIYLQRVVPNYFLYLISGNVNKAISGLEIMTNNHVNHDEIMTAAFYCFKKYGGKSSDYFQYVVRHLERNPVIDKDEHKLLRG